MLSVVFLQGMCGEKVGQDMFEKKSFKRFVLLSIRYIFVQILTLHFRRL